jgi:hypothetical protein
MHIKPAFLHLSIVPRTVAMFALMIVGVVLSGFSIAPARADWVPGLEPYSGPFTSGRIGWT